MQNSLDRLLEGIATALHDRVLPAVDDASAAAQVRAAIELIGNLAARVSWDVATLVEVRDAVTPVLEEVAAGGAPVPGLDDVLVAPPGPSDPIATRADVAARLAALGRCQTWLATADDVAPALRVRVDQVVDRHLEHELALLRSGSWAQRADGTSGTDGDAT